MADFPTKEFIYLPLDNQDNVVVPQTIVITITPKQQNPTTIQGPAIQQDGDAYRARFTPESPALHKYKLVATFADGTKDVKKGIFNPNAEP